MGSTPQSETLILEYRKNYPKPAAPVSPVLSLSAFAREKKADAPSILDLPNKLFVTSGRAAIVLALQHAGIKSGDQVLVPAYHCESMVSPVRHIGATPVFYKINDDTSANLSSCETLLNAKTRAIIVTHYFGFPQDLNNLRQLCDNQNLIMIEDCAHCLFGRSHGVGIGSIGDYAIASTMKFFPVFDGGILASKKENLANIKLHPPPLAFQFKSALTVVERAASYDRLGLSGKLIKLASQIKDMLWGLIKAASGKKNNGSSSPASAEGGFGLDPEWVKFRASKASKFILRKCSKQRIATLRRLNYRRYASMLTDLSGCQPLHQLTDDTVPLVFAARFDNTEIIFDRLKREAVPIWRFGEFLDAEMAEQTCPISFDYSKSILQFPCHQEMQLQEIDWIIERIKAACTAINQ